MSVSMLGGSNLLNDTLLSSDLHYTSKGTLFIFLVSLVPKLILHAIHCKTYSNAPVSPCPPFLNNLLNALKALYF